MIKQLKKLLGFCEHDLEHVSNIMTWAGPEEVLQCRKCFKLFYRKWPNNE